MRRFIINEEILKNIPDLTVGVVIINGLDNSKRVTLGKEFKEISKSVKTKFTDMELSEYPVIRAWRNVYKSFGEKKNRSSIEALIKRITNGKEIPSINPLVDIYNIVSLKHEMPCGGEDLAVIDQDIELTYARGDEIFIPLGSDERERPLENEIIYKFGNTVICRSFNYRESDLTKLTEHTTSSILVIENLQGSIEDLNNAINELSYMVTKYLGGRSKTIILDKTNNSIEL